MGEEYRKNVVQTNNLDEIYNTVSGFIQILRYENVEDIHFYRNYDALVDFIRSDKLALVKRCAFVFRDDCVNNYDYEKIKQVRSVVLQCNKYIDAYNSIASLFELGDCEQIWRSRYWGVLQALGFDEPITGEDIYADWFQWEHFGIDPDECSGFIIFELYFGEDDDNVVATDAVSGDGDLPGDSEAQAATTVINADVVATDAVSGDGDLSGGVEVQAAKTVTSAGQVFSAVVNTIWPPSPPPPPPAASAAPAQTGLALPSLAPRVASAAPAQLVEVSTGGTGITPGVLLKQINDMKLKNEKGKTDQPQKSDVGQSTPSKTGNRKLDPPPKTFEESFHAQVTKAVLARGVAMNRPKSPGKKSESDSSDDESDAAHTKKSV